MVCTSNQCFLTYFSDPLFLHGPVSRHVLIMEAMHKGLPRQVNSRGRAGSPVAMMVVSMLSVCGRIGSDRNLLTVRFFVMAYMLSKNGVVRKEAGSLFKEESPREIFTLMMARNRLPIG